MGVKRVYAAWGLLFVGVVAIGLSLGSHWYVVETDLPPQAGSAFMRQWGIQQQQADIDDPRQQYHTSLWTEIHWMIEGGSGSTRGYESAPHIGQVLAVTQTFFVIGLVGLLVAVVGLMFRARGLADGKGVIASFAVVSMVFLLFALTYFGASIPEAYNQQVNDDWGASPELAFYTFGTDTEEGTWQNVMSGPGLGWYAAVGGILALGGSFGLVYAGDLRRVRAALLDDDVAAELRSTGPDRRPHVMERIRQGGGRE